MEKTINWIHISDLHYGQGRQDTLLPKLKNEFFKDVEKMKSELGKFDIVFFTGDLTFSGKKAEFDKLTAFLKELWALFAKLDSNPILIAIPGNHDVERQDNTKSSVRGLVKYHDDKELQNILWNNLEKGNDYYDLITACFRNFLNWYNEIDLPKPNITHGIIPGDISTSLEINGIKINCLGLNTAFLDINNDDFKGKLALHNKQVMALTGGDHFEWLKKADISLLLTHHDVSWLDNESLDMYNSDINPPGAYYSHLCGHVHIAESSQVASLGSASKRLQLAPSLFGLQVVNGLDNRIHGYYAGSYKIEDSDLIETFYPRIVHKRYNGDYGIIPDFGFNLNASNSIIITTTLNNHQEQVSNEKILQSDDVETIIPQTKKNVLNSGEMPVDLSRLELSPRIHYKYTSHNAAVRLVEQKNFVSTMQSKRYAWLISDWGLNENGFIGSVITDILVEQPKNSFLFNCEDLITTDELLQAFTSQFGLVLQNFCELINGLGPTLITFKDLDTNIFSTQGALNRFKKIIHSILDYAPAAKIVITTRQVPEQEDLGTIVKLTPLDIAQTKSYIQNFQDVDDELGKGDNLEKIFSTTGGVPKHIDRIVENLQVASLDEVIEAESEIPILSLEADPIPKALLNAIGTLSESMDKYRQRSWRLLKVLTILANGETLENLKRLNPTEPLYPSNASELQQLSLLEVNTVNRILSQIGNNDTQQFKVLKVPRQIRDYVNTLITDSERQEILDGSYTIYFGQKWREGEIRNLHSSTFNGKVKYLNIENYSLLIKHIVQDAVKAEDDYSLARAANISILYCKQLHDQDDYKNTEIVAESIYNYIKNTELTSQIAGIMRLLGEARRMNGNTKKAIEVLKESLEFDEGIYSNATKNSIHIDLAYAYLRESDFRKAQEHAKYVEKNSEKDTVANLQAKYILVRATFNGDELKQKLRVLENKARRFDFQNLADNINLTITARLNNDEDAEEKSKRLAKVVESKTIYTRIRAIISKAIDEVENNSISDELLFLLTQSYSYLYAQRMEHLFSKCHKALWLYCVNNQRYSELLNLFKFSSFYWRIFDEIAIEKEYFLELKNDAHFINHRSVTKFDQVNKEYFNRRELEFSRA